MAENRNLAVQWDDLFSLSCFTGQFMVTTEKPTETNSLNCVPLLETVHIYGSGPYLYHNSLSKMVTKTEKLSIERLSMTFQARFSETAEWWWCIKYACPLLSLCETWDLLMRELDVGMFAELKRLRVTDPNSGKAVRSLPRHLDLPDGK